jgi:hypothetical protein
MEQDGIKTGSRPTTGGWPRAYFAGYRQVRDLADKAARRRIRRLPRMLSAGVGAASRKCGGMPVLVPAHAVLGCGRCVN